MSGPKKYTVGWICAIRPELVAARLFLDEKHEEPAEIAAADENSYTLGRIHKHNVVIAVLPDGEYGTSSAAAMARNMLHSFPNIKIGLMVGIGGGAPTPEHDIRLGDVVVSTPRNGNSGVFEYDFGKTIQEQAFQPTKHLDQSPAAIRAAVTSLRVDYETEGHHIRETIEQIVGKIKRLNRYRKPDISTDLLYQPHFLHSTHGKSTDGCSVACGADPGTLVTRKRRDEDHDDPTIHYGLVASGNKLMKDATIRDRLAAERGVLCFEMEAAGLMNHFPCLVIRGVCDYSDTHKNDIWHNYAAMTAAAYAADLLKYIHPKKVEAERTILEAIGSVHEDVQEIASMISDNQVRDDIAIWLKGPDSSKKHNAVQESRHEGTGTWLLADPKYRSWKSNKGSFLWLSGIAGCGKTVLSSTVIDDLRNSGSSACCIYFYFQFDDSTNASQDQLLRSLLSQLYWQRQEARKCIEALWKDVKRQQPTAMQLYNCLVASLIQSGQTWIVIDALDESKMRSGANPQGTLAFVENLRQDTLNCAHILATSRAEQDIEQAFSWAIADEMITLQHSLISEDIGSYIDYELQHSGRFDRWKDRADVLERVKSTLMQQADGMFRWVFCQLETLANCFDPRSLGKALSSLPKGLDETYHRMIQQLQPENRSSAITILRLLIFSDTPLTVQELVDAIAVDTTATPPKFDRNDRMPRPIEISRYCPGLVTVQRVRKERDLHGKSSFKEIKGKEITEVRLAHFSVKEFLTSNRLQGDLLQQMDRRTSRSSLITICITYLSHLTQKMSKSELKKEFPFARYAAKSWLGHATSLDEMTPQVSSLTLDFLLSNNTVYENWFCLYDPDTVFREYKQSWRTEDPAQPLYYASLYGLTGHVRSMLSYPIDVNARGGYYNYALHAAAARGHEEVVELLLVHGANPELEGLGRQTAIHLAAKLGCEGTIQLLLDAKADVNSIDDYHITPLETACGFGNINIVQLLLNRGAEYQFPNGNSVLVEACKRGNQDVVHLLLENDFPPNEIASALSAAAVEGYTAIISVLLHYGETLQPPLNLEWHGEVALIAASKYGYEDIVSILLRNGACPSITSDNYKYTALAVAVKGRHHSVVQMLIDAGADVNMGTPSLMAPLGIACQTGQMKMVQLLLERGASVNWASGGEYSSPLEAAISHGNTDIAMILLSNGAGVNQPREYPPGSEGCGALVAACLGGYESLVETLLEMGAAANSSGYVGLYSRWDKFVELHENYEIYGDETVLQFVVSKGYSGIGKKLIKYGADVERVPKYADFKTEWEARPTPLFRAYERNNWPIIDLLLDNGADINTPAGDYPNNYTLAERVCLDNDMMAIQLFLDRGFDLSLGLPVACSAGHLELAQLLLDFGVDPEVESSRFGNALGAASFGGHRTIVELLLRSGVIVAASFAARPLQSAPWFGNALQAASFAGHTEIVRLLVDNGADVNLKGGECGTPINFAAKAGHQSIVIMLLEAGARVDSPGEKWESTLQACCHQDGSEDVVRTIVGRGITFSEATWVDALVTAAKSGGTKTAQALLECWPAAVPMSSEALAASIYGGSEKITRMILRKFHQFSDDGTEALHAAAASAKKKVAIELLNRGANQHSPSSRFFDALIAAASGGSYRIVNYLLDQGAEPNRQFGMLIRGQKVLSEQSEAFGSALHAAVSKGHVQVVALLLNRGGDPCTTAGKHKNLLEAALSGYWHEFKTWQDEAESRSDMVSETPPTMDRRFETILQILFNNGADRDCTCEDYNEILVRIASAGFKSVVSKILKKDTMANISTETRCTALNAALSAGHSRTAWVLIDNDAVVSDWGHVYTPSGKMILHYAAMDGRKDLVQRCIDAGVNVNKKESDVNSVEIKNGPTPLHYASQYGHHEIIRVLLMNGAGPSLKTRDHYGRAPLSHARGKNHKLCVKALLQWRKDEFKSPSLVTGP